MIFSSLPQFLLYTEKRGREGHNKKGDETSINFFDRTTVPGMERAQEEKSLGTEILDRNKLAN